MNKENCALKLVDEIILYYDARSKKHQNTVTCIRNHFSSCVLYCMLPALHKTLSKPGGKQCVTIYSSYGGCTKG